MIIPILFALAILGGGCANEKSPAPLQSPQKAPPAAEKKVAPKSRVKVFTGTMVAVDQTAGTVTVKGPKSEKEFQVGERAKRQLNGLRLGDKLLVKHVDETAFSIVKLRASTSALVFKEKKIS